MFDEFIKDPNFLTNLFDTMRDGLMLLDTDGKNRLYKQGCRKDNGVNRTLAAMHPDVSRETLWKRLKDFGLA